ncbi:hypothetical protein IPL68_01850 [Candidatus Saccharibacteria bacterium]|nr:MAG: hypothetical protein IPL68_01850 [Candidatus Saccharibacteria bacterium]
MKELKRATIIFLTFLLLVAVVSVVLAFVPVRQRQVDVPKGFYYGESVNQVATQDAAKFTRKWYGFPATVAEKEVVSYVRGNYESATYDIQRFSVFYAVVNVVFWLGLVAALLAPVTIFYRPQKQAVKVKTTEKKTESQVKVNENTGD